MDKTNDSNRIDDQKKRPTSQRDEYSGPAKRMKQYDSGLSQSNDCWCKITGNPSRKSNM